jgi:hypothetical protein
VTPTAVELRLPHPDHLVPKKVQAGVYDASRESVRIDAFREQTRSALTSNGCHTNSDPCRVFRAIGGAMSALP